MASPLSDYRQHCMNVAGECDCDGEDFHPVITAAINSAALIPEIDIYIMQNQRKII